MKKIALGLVFCVSIFGISCNSFLENDVEENIKKNEQEIQAYIATNKLQMLKTTSGIHYLVTQNTLGRNVEIGDEVTMHYVLSLLSGSRIDSTSRLKNEPAKAIYGGTIGIEGVREALSLLKEGEKGSFLIPSVLAFGSQSNVNIPAYSVIKFDVEVLKYRSEEQQIEEYVKGTKLPVTEKTSTGLRIIKTLTSNGAELKTGQTATVKYTGYLASNVKQFDTGQLDVALGDGAVVKGFEEGIMKMKVGEKATIVFPSAIGYGVNGSKNSQGVYTIPPYSPLIFTLEVVSVK